MDANNNTNNVVKSTKRVLFSKGGELIFISHLDLTHTFVRALNRAQMPVAYSSGFNPHPKLVFAMPLSVGSEGKNELCDITLKTDSISDREFEEALKRELPEQICIKKVYAPDVKFGDVKDAKYTVTIHRGGLAGELDKALSGELVTMKKTKSGIKEVELSSRIKSYSLEGGEGETVLKLVLDASSEGYLNPELVMTALKEKNVICAQDTYFVSRDEILF